MTEERRAAPLDGVPNAPGFGPPSTPPDVTANAPATRDASPSTSSIPPRDGSMARRRLSLRIPDDEITRPSPSAEDRGPAERATRPQPSPLPPVDVGIVTPTRIIAINAEPVPFREPAPPEPPTVPTLMREEGETPSSPDFAPLSDSQVATPRTPVPLDADEVEVKFEDDSAPAKAIAAFPPAEESERRSDPPPEVAAEDLFAVEPTDPPPADGITSMGPRAPSQPPVPRAGLRAAIALARPSLVIVPPHVGSIPPQASDQSGSRRKGRFWWEELFNDDYVRASEKITDEYLAREVRFIEESLGVERGGALLDLGCGAGRHAVELARRGYEVVGYDLSLAMLARAGEEAQERQAKITFVQGDMREMAFDEQFDGVYCWNTSFGYFEEDKNAQVIDRVHRALKGGGLFLLDVINRDFLVRQSPSLAWFEGDGCVCMDEMSIDFITSRMKVKRTMMLDDGRSREIEYTIRVYSLYELGKVLHEHGFKVREVSGGLAAPGVFFGSESPRVIVLAEKR